MSHIYIIELWEDKMMTFDKIKEFVLDTFFEEIEYDENEDEILVDEDDEEDV